MPSDPVDEQAHIEAQISKITAIVDKDNDSSHVLSETPLLKANKPSNDNYWANFNYAGDQAKKPEVQQRPTLSFFTNQLGPEKSAS